LKLADLDDDRQRDDDEEAAEQDTSSSVRVMMARPASAPPRAREPVSPMKILAGEAFHHRKPKHAPGRGRGEDRQVQRVADVVAVLRGRHG
jgi:hypothetical protein